MAIVLHPHKTLLRPSTDLWLSLFSKFICYMNRAFSLDSDQAMSSRGTRTRARTNQCDMIAAHACICLCDELKPSVNESRCLDGGMQSVS